MRKKTASETGKTSRKGAARGKGRLSKAPPAPAAPEKEMRSPSLPAEYGENDLFLIAVDPDVVYASWEINKDAALKKGNPSPTLRFFDVSAIDFDGTDASCCVEMLLPSRVGTGFFHLRMPGRVVAAEIGYYRRGRRFSCIMRSGPLEFPPWPGPDDIWPDGYGPESERPPGY